MAERNGAGGEVQRGARADDPYWLIASAICAVLILATGWDAFDHGWHATLGGDRDAARAFLDPFSVEGAELLVGEGMRVPGGAPNLLWCLLLHAFPSPSAIGVLQALLSAAGTAALAAAFAGRFGRAAAAIGLCSLLCGLAAGPPFREISVLGTLQGLLALSAAAALSAKGRPAWIFLSAFLLAVSAQFHLSAAFLLPFSLACALEGGSPRAKPALAFAAGAVLPYLPWLAAHLSGTAVDPFAPTILRQIASLEGGAFHFVAISSWFMKSGPGAAWGTLDPHIQGLSPVVAAAGISALAAVAAILYAFLSAPSKKPFAGALLALAASLLWYALDRHTKLWTSSNVGAMASAQIAVAFLLAFSLPLLRASENRIARPGRILLLLSVILGAFGGLSQAAARDPRGATGWGPGELEAGLKAASSATGWTIKEIVDRTVVLHHGHWACPSWGREWCRDVDAAASLLVLSRVAPHPSPAQGPCAVWVRSADLARLDDAAALESALGDSASSARILASTWIGDDRLVLYDGLSGCRRSFDSRYVESPEEASARRTLAWPFTSGASGSAKDGGLEWLLALPALPRYQESADAFRMVLRLRPWDQAAPALPPPASNLALELHSAQMRSPGRSAGYGGAAAGIRPRFVWTRPDGSSRIETALSPGRVGFHGAYAPFLVPVEGVEDGQWDVSFEIDVISNLDRGMFKEPKLEIEVKSVRLGRIRIDSKKGAAEAFQDGCVFRRDGRQDPC